MALHTQRQRLQPLQEEPVVKGAGSWTKVTQQLYPCLDDISQRAKRFDKTQAMIGGIRICQAWEPATCRPVELAAIDDNTTNGGSMTTNEFRRRVHNDIRAMFEWLHQVRCCQRIINDERNAMLMSYIGGSLEIQCIQPWVA